MAATALGGETNNRPDETTSSSRLIASDRVEGTPVRRPDGERVGTVKRLVIEKRSGRVAYVVLSVGGVLGIGGERHTVPWAALSYSTEHDSYVLDADEDRLRAAPRRGADDAKAETGAGHDPSFDQDWEEHVHKYFNTSPYWNEDAPRATHETRER